MKKKPHRLKKEIEIKVIGTHKDIDGDNHETIEDVHTATYIQTDADHYIFYEEEQEGFGKIQTKIAIYYLGYVRIVKKGVIHSDMEFHWGEESSCEYKTPFSSTQITYKTDHMGVHIGNAGDLSIHIQYTMNLDGEPYSESSVKISTVKC